MKTWFKQMCGLGVLAAGVATVSADGSWGHNFSMGNASSIIVGSSPGSARFTAASAMTITGATINLNLVIPNGSSVDPTLFVGLQADNGSGAANGVFLGSGSVTATGAGDWSVNFGSSVSLTPGTVYHLVVSNATAGSSAFWRDLGYANTNQPRDNFPDPKWGDGFAFNSGSFGQGNLVYLLHSTSGSNYGQPYTTSLFAPMYSDIIQGEEFTYLGENNQKLVSVTLRLNTGASTPSGALDVALLDTSNTILASGVLPASSAVLNNWSNYDIALSGLPVLTAGTRYRLVAYSAGAVAGDWDLVQNYTTKGSDYAWNSASFQGTNGFAIRAFSFNPASASYFNPGDDRDTFFNLNTIPEPTAAMSIVLAAGLLWNARRSVFFRRQQ